MELESGEAVTLLGEANGYQLLEGGRRLLFVDRGWGFIPTLRFVLGLLAFIFGINGLIFGITASLPAGGVLLGLATVFGVALQQTFPYLERRRAAPVKKSEVLAIVARDEGKLLDGEGQALADLSTVRFAPAMQLTSSASALEASYAGGKLVVARGNPLSRSIDEILDALKRAGLRTSQ